MRLFVLTFVCALMVALTTARADPTVSMADPGAYSSTIAAQMQTEGMDPLRATFTQISGSNGQLAANIDANLTIFDRAIAHRPARLMREIEDVTLADTVRHIYYYHYYGDDAWVFTRFEFVRIGDNRWALAGLTFSSSWAVVTLGTTPDFHPTQPAAH